MRSTALRLPFQSTYWWSIARTYSWVLSRTSIKFNVSVFSSNLQPLHFAFPWRGCLFHNSFTLRMDFTLFATLDWVLPCPSIFWTLLCAFPGEAACSTTHLHSGWTLLCLLHLIGIYYVLLFYWTSLCISWRGCSFYNSFTLRMDFTFVRYTWLDSTVMSFYFTGLFSVHSALL